MKILIMAQTKTTMQQQEVLIGGTLATVGGLPEILLQKSDLFEELEKRDLRDNKGKRSYGLSWTEIGRRQM